MNVGTRSLPDTINPNSFPAKLWRMVNNPAIEAICWDSRGEVVIIHQQLFQRSILFSPGCSSLDKADRFRTTNFSSFLRQLNLYGFKQTDPAQTDGPNYNHGTYLYYSNSDFTRESPELVALLRRLTFDNKAKLQAGEEVRCRPPSRHHRDAGSGDRRDRSVKKGTFSQPQQQSNHPYYPPETQAQAAHNGTTVPPPYLIRGYVDGASTSASAVSSGHYNWLLSSPNAMHVQPAFLAGANFGNCNFTGFNTCTVQDQPGYSPYCHYYHPNIVASHMTGSERQAAPYPPHSYKLNVDQNQELKKEENQEVNLDTVFQMAEGAMQTPSNNCPVKVEPAETLC